MRSSKVAELLIAAQMMGMYTPYSKTKEPKYKPYKKDLSEYNTPPRSMTEEEKAYYDKHKKLDGFGKQ